MPRPLFVLIPPSEGKVSGGDGPSWRRGRAADAELDAARATVLAAARQAGAVRRGAPTLPAMERYDGVLYRELAWSSLPTAARARGDAQVRIASGLLGLVAPSDPVPDHRLKMSDSLPETGRLSTWWRPRLAPVLAALADGRVVWDLLPQEHAAACDWSSVEPTRRVTVRFIDARGRTVSHWNKLLKGSLVAWLLRDQPAGPEDLTDFDHPLGYRFDPAASDLDADPNLVVMRQA